MDLKKEALLGIFLFIACTISVVLILSIVQTSQITDNICPSIPKPTSVSLHVPVAPKIVSLDGQPALVYEVYFTNTTPLTLYKVEVLGSSASGPSTRLIKTIQGDELNKSLRPPMGGVSESVIFLFLEPERASIPGSLTHILYFKSAGASSSGSVPNVVVSGAPTTVREPATLILGKPFNGSNWFAANAPSNFQHHRTGIITFMGTINIPQRYAIDWMQIGDNGRLYRTDGSTNEDYYCYGADLLAVADGVVVDTKDGLPERKPWSVLKIPEPQLGGNYVLIDIGSADPGNQTSNHNYAFYAHMIPGSLKVKVGDHVKKGDVIGKLGSSGNSDAPHLHFHVSSSPEFLFSEGVPYVLDRYTLEGHVSNWNEVLSPNQSWSAPASYVPSDYVSSAMPGDNDVVSFGG